MIQRLLLLSIALLLLLGGYAQPASARDPSVVPDHYIVVLKKSVTDPGSTTERLERKNGFAAVLRYKHALKGFAAKLSAGQVRALESDPSVDYVAPDRVVKATGFVPLASGEPTPPTGIRRIEAATQTSALQASSVNVAVIDTGIQLNHPDLNAVSGTNCIKSGNPAADDNGHGTHVAGTIAARNNGAGVVGVAPGTKVYAVKVLNRNGVGFSSQIICGIDWVTATRTDSNPSNDIAVANESFGGAGPALEPCATTTDPEHQAICDSVDAGVTYVVAAGNDGLAFDDPSSPQTPAAYPEVLTATAIADSDGVGGGLGAPPSCRTSETDDSYALFSDFASTPAGSAHTIAGPGTCITSTYLNSGYAIASGTSMATPHVVGVAAFCLGAGGACAGMTPSQVIQKLRADGQQRVSALPSYGFDGDPTRPVAGEYFGYLAWSAAGTQADYDRPISASPLRVPLVPAFKACTAGNVNSAHGAPLDFSSCNPPQRGSSTARLGSGSIGFALVAVCNVGTTAPVCDQLGLVKPDIRLISNLRDVRCVGSSPSGCTPDGDYNPNGAAGPYTTMCTTAALCGNDGNAEPYCAQSGSSASACIAGTDLTEIAEIPGATAGGTGTFHGRGVRITDSYNQPGPDRASTVVDIGFPIPIDCIGTSSTSLGSSCGVNTSANALAPGAVRSGDKAVWQLGEIKVVDSGPDGVRGNSDDEPVAVQGIYLP